MLVDFIVCFNVLLIKEVVKVVWHIRVPNKLEVALLRFVPRHNVNKENESNKDTEPGYCTSTALATVGFRP